jgi:hypothetical protein
VLGQAARCRPHEPLAETVEYLKTRKDYLR